MTDVTGREIATLCGSAGRMTLETGCMSASSARYRERDPATGGFVTRTASNIRMPGVVESGAETLQSRKRLDLRAFRFRSRVTSSTYRVFQAGELLRVAGRARPVPEPE